MTPYQYKTYDGNIVDISYKEMSPASTAKIAAQRGRLHQLKASLLALREAGYTREEISGYTHAILKGRIIMSMS